MWSKEKSDCPVSNVLKKHSVSYPDSSRTVLYPFCYISSLSNAERSLNGKGWLEALCNDSCSTDFCKYHHMPYYLTMDYGNVLLWSVGIILSCFLALYRFWLFSEIGDLLDIHLFSYTFKQDIEMTENHEDTYFQPLHYQLYAPKQHSHPMNSFCY